MFGPLHRQDLDPRALQDEPEAGVRAQLRVRVEVEVDLEADVDAEVEAAAAVTTAGKNDTLYFRRSVHHTTTYLFQLHLHFTPLLQ